MAVVINGTSGITGNTGTLISATTIGVGGATPSASGAGITFPATVNLSSNANTLDDYEEGTFTPTVANGANTNTLSNVYAYYTKIGNQVMIQGTVNATVVTANILTYVTLGNLPFSPLQTSIGSCFANNNIRSGNIQAIVGQTYLFFGVDSQLVAGAEIFQYSITYTTSL